MTAPIRPSLDEIVQRVDGRPSLDEIVAKADAPPETAGDKIAGGLSALYQGLTLGAGNKISAAIRALAGGVNAGVDISNPAGFATALATRYPSEFETMTAPLNQFRENHPVANAALELAGSVPTMMVGGGITPARTLLGRVGQLAGQGAGYGAASGAFSADRPEDILPGAAVGLAVGGATAPVLGGLLGYYRGTTGAGAKADRMLADALRSGGVEPTQVRVGPAEPSTIMDIGSRGPMQVARAARNTAGSGAAQKIDDVLTKRAQEAAGRIQSALSETTGIPREQFGQTLDDLIATRKVNADKAYASARDAAPLAPDARASSDGPSLADLFKRPSMQKAMRHAADLATERGETPPANNVFQALGLTTPEAIAAFKAQNPKFAKMGGGEVSYSTLHEWKTALDDMLGYAKTGGTLPDGTPAKGQMLRAIQDTKNELLDIMDAHNPAYAAARSQFAGESAMKNAFEDGRRFFASSQMASDGAAELKSLTPAEQEMWRRGGMTWLQDKIQKLAANPDLPAASRKVNVLQRTLGGSEDAAKARLLFDSDKAYQTFIEKMGPEAIYPKTNAALLNQSSTAAQLNESRAFSPMDVYYASSAIRGKPWGVAHVIASLAGRGRMSPDVADAVASRVTKQGDALNQYLATLGLPAVRRGPVAAARGAGIVGGLLAPR